MEPSRAFDMITERIVFANKELKSEPFMDVFVYRTEQNGDLTLADAVSRIKFPKSRMSRQEAFPLRHAPLRHGTNGVCNVSVPNRPEALLKRLYGDHWRTQFVVSTHSNRSILLPCTLSDEQSRALGFIR